MGWSVICRFGFDVVRRCAIVAELEAQPHKIFAHNSVRVVFQVDEFLAAHALEGEGVLAHGVDG